MREGGVQVPPLALAPGKVAEVYSSHMEELHKAAGSRLVMVDVFTQWCGPCKVIAPEVEKMAEELGDQVVLTKLDATSDDGNKKWAMAEKVRALPTFIFFKNGERIGEMSGAKTDSLRKMIEARK